MSASNGPAATDPARAIESLLAFWADGGVDAMLLDTPVDRIAAGRVPPPRPAPVPTAPPSGPARRRLASPEPDVAAAVETARRLAGACETLEALSEAIAGFDGCPLRFEGAATQAVVWRGDPDAPVLVVGEGPGADEDRQGQPFVGRSGQLLDRMFAAAGLSGRVLITNTVFWRPPGNRDPTPAEQAVCAPFLERIIALTRPRVLLLIGGPSAKSMLKRDEGIMKLRGRWAEWRSEDGASVVPALPTLHPAFLLRNPIAKRDAWRDLLTLTARLEDPGASRG
jgi:uracil-DNA glycosylase